MNERRMPFTAESFGTLAFGTASWKAGSAAAACAKSARHTNRIDRFKKVSSRRRPPWGLPAASRTPCLAHPALDAIDALQQLSLGATGIRDEPHLEARG